MNEAFPFEPVAGAALALLCLVFVLRAGRRQRLVDSLPTLKTTGVFIGLVELKGTAETEHPLTSYLAETACVHYRFDVEEHWSRTVTETYTDEKGNTQTRTRTESGWTTLASGGQTAPFYLQDDCGVVRVQPEGAKIEPDVVFNRTCGQGDPLYYTKGPATAVSDSDHRRRFVEKAIPLHARLYVVGQARERDDVIAPEIAADQHAPMFLISTRSEEQVSRRLGWTFWLLALLGAALAVGGFVVRDARANRELVAFIPTYATAAGVYLGAWFIGWLVMAYNSLVGLRQRVRQAWANVNVQLRRRADLITNLVAGVKGLRDYEMETQTELAHLRAQLTATAPGEPGPDHQACAKTIAGLTERYPQLRASEAFLGLQRGLSDTEQRIALARSYFNDIATFYNTHLETIPDRFICALGGMKPQALMTAGDFERAPVEVNLSGRQMVIRQT